MQSKTFNEFNNVKNGKESYESKNYRYSYNTTNKNGKVVTKSKTYRLFA